MLSGCHGKSMCGFMSSSGYDALAKRAASLSSECSLVVVTAVFGRKDKLQQPAGVWPSVSGCFFAFVDDESASFLLQTAPPSVAREGALSDERIGAWRLLKLPLTQSPYVSPRRASRVPKLLTFRFFPSAEYSVWLDGKLKLLVDPHTLVRRFLSSPHAAIALPRNLRRDHIDEEMAWIRSTLAEEPEKLVASDARAVEAQWRYYEAEQRNASSTWMARTACAEGAMIVTNLRSPLAKCVLCAWYNEWHRFGERDQLSLSYVLHSMGLSPPAEAPASTPAVADETTTTSTSTSSSTSTTTKKKKKKASRGGSAEVHRGVYFWPRQDHWHYKRNRAAGEAKRPAFVKYVGHGGCQATGQRIANPGCADKRSRSASQTMKKSTVRRDM